MATVKKKRIPEERLPVPPWYGDLPVPYRKIVSEQALAIMQREGITDSSVEADNASAVQPSTAEWLQRAAGIGIAIQSRDLLCQLLLEERKQTALLERIAKVAEHG